MDCLTGKRRHTFGQAFEQLWYYRWISGQNCTLLSGMKEGESIWNKRSDTYNSLDRGVY